MSFSKLTDLDVTEIQRFQCNRPPMLFVDRILEAIPGVSAVGMKNFTYNEWFFPEHYPDDPNVPGFVLVEAMVQVLLMTFLTIPEHTGERTNFVKINEVSFRKKVIPGDQLLMTATLQKFKRGIATGDVLASVEGEPKVEGVFTVALPKILETFKPKV